MEKEYSGAENRSNLEWMSRRYDGRPVHIEYDMRYVYMAMWKNCSLVAQLNV